ncbi:MAG: hypothetical protein K2N38_05910 [Oscillospiraceae bacterium]|nr:hypothetical protein [Oscillospiraceae bacterium]
MNSKLKCIIGAALFIIFIDLMVMGMKIFNENYNILVEGVVGFIGFAIVGGCGVLGLCRELKKRAQHKKGKI